MLLLMVTTQSKIYHTKLYNILLITFITLFKVVSTFHLPPISRPNNIITAYLVFMNIMKSIEQLECDLFAFSYRKLHFRILQQSGQVMLTKLEYKIDTGLELTDRLCLTPAYFLSYRVKISITIKTLSELSFILLIL